MYKFTPTYGGFVKENIERFVIKESLTSGNPSAWLMALREAVEEIDDAQRFDDDYWDNAAEEFSE